MLKMTTDWHQTYQQKFLDKSSAQHEIIAVLKMICYSFVYCHLQYCIMS